MDYKNKGFGAGGSKTNKNGLNFEDITDTYSFLANKKFQQKKEDKKEYFHRKDDKEIYWFTKNSKTLFKKFTKKEFNIESIRYPDESVIIIEKDKINIFIIEKKNQNVEGSVETKLWAAPTLKREFEYIFKNSERQIKIHYFLTMNDWLFKKFNSFEQKWIFLKEELKENNILVFNGNDENYFQDIFNHIV